MCSSDLLVTFGIVDRVRHFELRQLRLFVTMTSEGLGSSNAATEVPPTMFMFNPMGESGLTKLGGEGFLCSIGRMEI